METQRGGSLWVGFVDGKRRKNSHFRPSILVSKIIMGMKAVDLEEQGKSEDICAQLN